MTIKAQRITDSIAHHAEGPVWWAATGRLRFVDMLHGTIIEIDAVSYTHLRAHET